MPRFLIAFVAAILVMAGSVSPVAAEPAKTAVAKTAVVKTAVVKTVVELFTSQGCSSCPPADKLLGELARRDDVLALSFHVDYWNYLGWRDPFSSAEATDRQRNYRRPLGKRYVYTPQMVINGANEAVGSNRATVLRLIEQARGMRTLDISVDHPGGDRAVVRIAGGPRPARPAAVWLMFYDRRHATEIRRGENEGVTLVNTNVVRVLKRIGSWTGEAVKIDLSLRRLGSAGRDACAVIVQQDGSGPILGAVSFDLPRG